MCSHVQLFETPWTVACQAPLSREFSRQEYWIGLPFPSPGNLPNPDIEPASLASPALEGGVFTTAPPKAVKWDSLNLKQCDYCYRIHMFSSHLKKKKQRSFIMTIQVKQNALS